MNKKLFLGMFAAATMLFATSCQNDELDAVQSGKESVVSFTLEQPGIATRAEYSDGLTATTLTYAVYEAGSKQPLIVVGDGDEDQVRFSGKTATVNLRLVTGKTYDILFWADNEAAPYTFDASTQTITVDYTTTTSQDENRDAFFAAEKSLLVDGAINKPITLYRPFAQLNIGTTDATESSTASFTPTQSEVKVKTVYKTLNLFDGKVSDPIEGGQTYSLANIPDDTKTFPIADVKYLSMNYLLVDAEKELVDIEFTVTDGSHSIEREYTSVPVQRNYRTNIYGKILTDPADLIINISSGYIDNHNVSVWDGTTATEFTKDKLEASEIKLESAADLAGLVKVLAESNNNVNMFAGQTITLETNIDLNGYEWNPIGNIVGGGVFGGTFDGNGHTIYNLKAKSVHSNDNECAGLFGALRNNGVIKNVNVVGAEITSGKYAGVIVGHMNGAGTNIINCHVSDVTIVSNKHSAGGIVGFITGNAACKVENCTVTGANIKVLVGRAGGLIGRIQGGIVKDCAVKNISISPLTEGATLEYCGDFIGRIDNQNYVTLEGTNTVDGEAYTMQ